MSCFLCREEDITETEYNGFFGKKPIPARGILSLAAARLRKGLPHSDPTEPENAVKVNLVCDALLSAMLHDKKK